MAKTADLVTAMRCSSQAPTYSPPCTTCAYRVVGSLDGKEYTGCDCDRMGMDAADKIEELMACGFPRNDCHEAAQAVRVTECSYRDDMADWLRVFRCRRVFKRPNEGFEELSRCIDILQQALGV